MKKTALFKGTKRAFTKAAAAVLAVATLITAVPANVNAQTKSIQDFYIKEENFKATMADVVEPYLDQYKQTGFVTGNKNASLYYEKYVLENAKGTVVISHGNGENLEKFDEMIYYFLNMGYSVYGMEHRGHSRSGRLGSDSSQINVESFSYYFKDLKIFLDQIVVPEAGKENLYMFAHSMGGGIGARFLQTYPGYFKAAILSAPMLEIQSGNIPSFFAKLLAHGVSITPWKDKYVMGHGPYTSDYNFEGCHTQSEVRYARAWETRVNNPELQMGGNSYQWLSEAYHATNMATCPINAAKVKIPVLLFQAGKDTLVGDAGQKKFARYAKNCKLVRYAAGKHELWNETDEILPDYLNKVFNFLAEN